MSTQEQQLQLPPLHEATEELICDLADLFKIFRRYNAHANFICIIGRGDVCRNHIACTLHDTICHFPSAESAQKQQFNLQPAARKNNLLFLGR